MINQAIFEKISNLESELQKLKLEAYLQLPQKERRKLSSVADRTLRPRLTSQQIQKEIEAYRHGK